MKLIKVLLVLVVTLTGVGVSYMLSSVFGLLRWPVFILLFLFGSEMDRRIIKWIYAHYGNQCKFNVKRDASRG